MSGIEVVGLLLGALGLVPIVTDAWDRYRELSPEVDSFKALETRFRGVCHLYTTEISRLFAGETFSSHAHSPNDWPDERIQRMLEEIEGQRPGTKQLLAIINPTAELISLGLEEFNTIFSGENGGLVNGETCNATLRQMRPFIGYHCGRLKDYISVFFKRASDAERNQDESTLPRSSWINHRRRKFLSHKINVLRADIGQFRKLVRTFPSSFELGGDERDSDESPESSARYDDLYQAIHPRLMSCRCPYHDVKLLVAELRPPGSSGSSSVGSSLDSLRLLVSKPPTETSLECCSVEIEPTSVEFLAVTEPALDDVDSTRSWGNGQVTETPTPSYHASRVNTAGSDDTRVSEINDLCHMLSQELTLNPNHRNWVGSIPADQSTFHLYATGVGSGGQSPTFSKFQSVLKRRGDPQISTPTGLPKYQRLKLAADLALGFLNLQSTSWEEPDVWRMGDNEDIILHEPQGILHGGCTELYISRRFTSVRSDRNLADLLTDSSSDCHMHFGNASMWKLALLLIELCMNKTLREVRLPGTEFEKAHSLLNTRHIQNRFGVPYREAVQFCLFASTSGGSASELQKDFRSGVIDKIEKSRQFYA